MYKIMNSIDFIYTHNVPPLTFVTSYAIYNGESYKLWFYVNIMMFYRCYYFLNA